MYIKIYKQKICKYYITLLFVDSTRQLNSTENFPTIFTSNLIFCVNFDFVINFLAKDLFQK